MRSISMLQEDSIYCEQLKRDYPALYVKHVKQYQNEEQRKKLEREFINNKLKGSNNSDERDFYNYLSEYFFINNL